MSLAGIGMLLRIINGKNLVYCLVPTEEEACLMLGKRHRIGLDNLVFERVLHVEAINPERDHYLMFDVEEENK